MMNGILDTSDTSVKQILTYPRNISDAALSWGIVDAPLQPNLWSSLIQLMGDKGKSANDLADFMEWSSAEQFHKWRRGTYRISRRNATRLARFLGVSLEELDPSGESFDMENRGPQRKSGPSSKVPTQPSDRPDAEPARGTSQTTSGDFAVPDDPFLSKVRTLYQWFRLEFGDEDSAALFEELKATTERVMADKRKVREKVKN